VLQTYAAILFIREIFGYVKTFLAICNKTLTIGIAVFNKYNNTAGLT